VSKDELERAEAEYYKDGFNLRKEKALDGKAAIDRKMNEFLILIDGHKTYKVKQPLKESRKMA